MERGRESDDVKADGGMLTGPGNVTSGVSEGREGYSGVKDGLDIGSGTRNESTENGSSTANGVSQDKRKN